MSPPSFGQALAWWLKLGCISFGGPAGQVAVMHRELVERRRWIGEGRFLHALNYCMLLPGPEAQQLATYIGWLLHGIPGGVAAGALFVLPSFGLLMALSAAYVAWGAFPAAVTVLATVKAAVVAVVIAAAWRIGRRALKAPLAQAVAAAALSASLLGVPFPALVAGGAVAGALGARWMPRPGGHGAKSTGGPAVIDDAAPPPAHAAASWARSLGILATALVIGAGTWLVLPDPLRAMAVFFTGSALLTIGGAYAVLPYVTAGAVAHGWLTAPQIMDGLALGESTPGPLIMVVAFVGWLGAGAAGAAVATLYTFLPSFVFILLGAPVVERTRHLPAVHAPLAGITAAVVGVILHLGVVFGQHALVDPLAWGVAGASLLAMVRFEVGVVPVFLAAMAVGLGRVAAG